MVGIIAKKWGRLYNYKEIMMHTKGGFPKEAKVQLE